MGTDGEPLTLASSALASREAVTVAARVLSPRSPNVLRGGRVSRALELAELADEQPTLSDTASSGNALNAHVALRLKAARGTAPSKPSAAAVAALQISPGKRKRAHSLTAGASPPPSLAAASPGTKSPDGGDKALRARLLERRMEAPARAAPSTVARPKEKKKRKVDVVEAALERFRNEEAPSLSRCVAFSSRFCPPPRPSAGRRASTGAAESDDDVDDTDGESCPVDEPSPSPSPLPSPSPVGKSAKTATTTTATTTTTTRRGRLRVQVGVAVAQGARAYMEDRYSIVESLFEDETIESLDDDEMMVAHDPATGLPLLTTTSPSLLAIYDGHNGAFAADYARERFRELLAASEELRGVNRRARRGPMSAEDVAKVRALLVATFEAVDDEIVARTVRMGKRDGSTVLLGLLVGGKLFVANIGDSRGVFSRSARRALAGEDGEDDGEAVRVSVDHKPDCAKEAARVEAAGGKVVFSGCWRVAHDRVPLRLAISRSLGDHPLKVNLPESCAAPLVSVEPDISVVDVAGAQGELLVFASDGLWDRLSDHDAVRLARAKVAERDAGGAAACSPEALRDAARALVADALAKRSMDNVTAMVVSWAAMP